MSTLPARIRALTDQALLAVRDPGQQAELRQIADLVTASTWRFCQAWRPPEDNRPEHEWVVFANALAIAEDEGLTLSEKRIATAFSFTHDTHFIPRIPESRIRRLREEGGKLQETDPAGAQALFAQADNLAEAKKHQRQAHMEGGARIARFLLNELDYPGKPGLRVLTDQEIEKCITIIARHDCWKLGEPHPPGHDRLEVVCFEADALWPLHPIGVLADLERPDAQGQTHGMAGPAEWQWQLRNSLRTLLEYRVNWKDCPGETFLDEESIFRTREGHRRYREWRAFWGI